MFIASHSIRLRETQSAIINNKNVFANIISVCIYIKEVALERNSARVKVAALPVCPGIKTIGRAHGILFCIACIYL